MNAGIWAHTRTRREACSCGACARGKGPEAKRRLMEIAVGLALEPDGDEQAARRRIEEALCADDEHVSETLIDAM